jgi:hypothetical protein
VDKVVVTPLNDYTHVEMTWDQPWSFRMLRRIRAAIDGWTVQYLVGRNRLESFEAKDLAALAEALVARAVLRVETTAS